VNTFSNFFVSWFVSYHAGLTLTPTGKLDIHAAMIELRTVGKSIVEALGTGTLTLEQLAPRAGYEVNGHFKKAVSLVSKRGILGNKRPGYFVQRPYQGVVNELYTWQNQSEQKY